MATTATVTAVGAAEFFVFLMTKRNAASATVSCRDVNVGFVNKFHEGTFFSLDSHKTALPRQQRQRSVLRCVKKQHNITEAVLSKSYKQKTPRQAQGLG
jgi:hypothetical protein